MLKRLYDNLDLALLDSLAQFAGVEVVVNDNGQVNPRLLDAMSEVDHYDWVSDVVVNSWHALQNQEVEGHVLLELVTSVVLARSEMLVEELAALKFQQVFFVDESGLDVLNIQALHSD